VALPGARGGRHSDRIRGPARRGRGARFGSHMLLCQEREGARFGSHTLPCQERERARFGSHRDGG
jgi:hypothetical protein